MWITAWLRSNQNGAGRKRRKPSLTSQSREYFYGNETLGQNQMSAEADSKLSTDPRAIQNLVEILRDSWNRHDMKVFSSVFSEDADFVNVGGIRLKGRDEIELTHAERHKTQFRESKMELGPIDIRFLDSHVAVVHGESRIEGDKNPDGTPRTSRRTIFTAIALKKIDEWKFVAFQNTNRS